MKKLLPVMLFIMFPVLAYGATYYVAKTGSDSNSCSSARSQSTPKLTINAGIGCLSGGDTLIVKAGTYNETIPDTIPSGSSGSPTVVKSEAKGGAMLFPNVSQPRPTGAGIILIGNDFPRSYITIDGFVVDGGNGMSGSVVGVELRGVSQASHHLTIKNMEIRNLPGVDDGSNTVGLVSGFQISDTLIQNNHIHHIGSNDVPSQHFFSYCMYLSSNGPGNIIEGNEYHHCSGYTIHGYSTAPLGSSGNTIRNNYFHDSGPVIVGCTSGIGHSNAFYNNILYRLGTNGYPDEQNALRVCGHDNVVYNNTIVGTGANGYCIYLENTSSAITVRNNICWQNNNNNIINQGVGNTIDHNLSGQDPLFMNAAAGDFHLRNGSPAIDAGVVMLGLAYNGSAPDLGALETGAGGQLPAPIHLRLIGN